MLSMGVVFLDDPLKKARLDSIAVDLRSFQDLLEGCEAASEAAARALGGGKGDAGSSLSDGQGMETDETPADTAAAGDNAAGPGADALAV